VDAPWLGSWSDDGYVRSAYAPEPPLCTCSRAGHGSVREPSSCAKQRVAGDRPRSGPGDGAAPNRTKRRGGSGGGNGGTVPRIGSRGIGRVGPSASKITRARNQKTPGTSGGGRNPEGEAPNQDSFRRNPPMGRLPGGSAHEPPPENVASGRDVVGRLDRRRVRA